MASPLAPRENLSEHPSNNEIGCCRHALLIAVSRVIGGGPDKLDYQRGRRFSGILGGTIVKTYAPASMQTAAVGA
jgi:hypothetical protein